MNPHNTITTGAELQTMREISGMTRQGLADRCGVEARTVKHWEARKSAGVPHDVAQIANNAARWVTQAAAEALRTVLESPHTPAEVVLLRYRETAHLHAKDRAHGLQADTHGGMVSRVAAELLMRGMPCRVVWFDQEQYARWLNEELLSEYVQRTGAIDTPQQRAAWAAGPGLAAQAIPHPSDQPPAAYTPQR